ncbi:hypothetical protein [Pimelobacter sp. 30-1]|uniref:hypothetical protein n=1 Tax=Pimelobacter sp. 30-1 TaxID=2004991 RepID=UPI001C05D6F5|nr:hypothetical protein [Pimelobacter sp. 30-1]MBU2693683.1 hypothetical protein [Pimelobacter sp. 30-1]
MHTPWTHLSRSAAAALTTFIVSVLLLLATTTSAHAGPTYTPWGGPSTKFVGTGIGFEDIEVAQSVDCSTFDLSGPVINPGVQRSILADFVTLSAVASSGCANPVLGACVVSQVGTWYLAFDGNAAGGTWPVKVRGMKVSVSCAQCAFTAEGTLKATFTPGTARLTPVVGTSGSGLVISSGAGAPTGLGCVLLDLVAGDRIAVKGHWTNVPPSGSVALTITEP